jgi:hypothetical protein
LIDVLIHTFEATVRFIEQSVTDLSDRKMVEQPAGVPNHATWTLGRIIHSCQGMSIELGAEPWLPDDWESTYGYGSRPLPDQKVYPRKPELLDMLADSRARVRQTLLSANRSVLGKALPDETLPTMSHVLWQVLVAHTAYHAGQLAVWRRAIGKESTGVFV